MTEPTFDADGYPTERLPGPGAAVMTLSELLSRRPDLRPFVKPFHDAFAFHGVEWAEAFREGATDLWPEDNYTEITPSERTWEAA